MFVLKSKHMLEDPDATQGKKIKVESQYGNGRNKHEFILMMTNKNLRISKHEFRVRIQ